MAYKNAGQNAVSKPNCHALLYCSTEAVLLLKSVAITCLGQVQDFYKLLCAINFFFYAYHFNSSTANTFKINSVFQGRTLSLNGCAIANFKFMYIKTPFTRFACHNTSSEERCGYKS